MNLKNRLNSIKIQEIAGYEIKNEKEVNHVFLSEEATLDVIQSIFSSNSNVILVSGSDCEKSLITSYIKNFIPDDTKLHITRDIIRDVRLDNVHINIAPECSVQAMVRVFEHIMTGYNGFIFGISLNNSNNFLEKIQTLISIHYPNLNEKQIKHLIGISNANVIFFAKNEDGLFCINKIAKIVMNGNSVKLKGLYNWENDSENSDLNMGVNSDDYEFNFEKELKIQNKINKYKHLKEIAKRKKNIIDL